MNKIPIAEEYFSSKVFNKTPEQVSIIMIEFAKIHVEAALEAAYINSYVDNNHQQGMAMDSDDFVINADSILNAYPLDNIK